jgi:glycosyltransferase involved in cell wall biosynthesis
MRIAYYAPLKPPTAATPSGDRRMARALLAALEHAGHRVDVASTLRTRDGDGDAKRQARLRDIGRRLAARLIRRYTTGAAARPDLWFTYHVYYKAPDWIGPAVSEALGIPYVIAEASYAPKRAGGPWAIGHDAAAAAIRAADRIVGINAANLPCVRPLLRDRDRLIPLRPFLDTGPFEQGPASRARRPADSGSPPSVPVLITAAMMRRGDKLASYRVLAEALARLREMPWRLDIIGDGAARRDIEALMAPLGKDRVRFLGQRDIDELPPLLGAADLFVWPAVREAYGMALLEAQAAGLPVVAGNAGGVAEIVRHGRTGLLTPEGDSAAFAEAVANLLSDPARRMVMGGAARTTVANDHSLESASALLDRIIAAARHRRAA